MILAHPKPALRLHAECRLEWASQIPGSRLAANLATVAGSIATATSDARLEAS